MCTLWKLCFVRDGGLLGSLHPFPPGGLGCSPVLVPRIPDWGHEVGVCPGPAAPWGRWMGAGRHVGLSWPRFSLPEAGLKPAGSTLPWEPQLLAARLGTACCRGWGGHCPPALISFLEKQHKNKVISRHLQTWMCVVGTSEGRCWAASPNLPVCCGAAAGAVFWCRSEWVGGCRGLNPSTPPYQARSVCITLVSPLQITSQAEPRRLCVSKRPEK